MASAVHLLSGNKIPLIGLGTFQMRGYDVLYKAIDAALKSGYRSFDTASVYRNETDIGKIFKTLLPMYNLKREDLFITSKLAPSEQGKHTAKAACLSSIERLECEYLDLYLIHWPGTHKLQPQDSKHKTFRQETWMDMEEAVKEGKCKSIGVSNYLPSHMEELLSHAAIKPAVLQLFQTCHSQTEYHPHLIQRNVKKLCDEHGIHLQAYSSLGTSKADNKLLSDPNVKEIADAIGKTPAQVLLRWAVQQNIAGLLCSKLLKDLRNTKVMVEVWALAVLGKTVTGPWMTKFYSSTMSNLEMGPLVRHCVTQMEEWIAEPSRLLHIHKNVFGGDLDSTDAVISSILLFDSSDDVLQLKAIGCVMGSALRVVVRQLHEFIDGRFLEPSADMMEYAASAPTHNMSSERALGSFDRLWRQAPNATLGFLNGKTRSKLNKTMEWLEGKDDVEKLNIIRFAIREAQSDRASKTLAQKRVFDKLSSRREDVMRQREKTARNAVVRELKLAFTETDPVLSKAYPMDAISRITDYVNQPESVIGTLVIHTTVNGQRYARVQAVKKDKLVISYWGFDDSEAISIDHSVPASAFYADVVLGSVLFL